MNRKATVFLCVLLVSSMMLTAAAVTAKKPSNPGGGGGPSATGTIYYRAPYEGAWYVYSMNADGSSKTLEHKWPGGSMSYEQHGDHWWYIGFQAIEGTYPDGQPKMDIVATRDDGSKSKTLTLDSSLSIDSYSCIPMWSKTDSFVSWSSLVWTTDSGGIPVVEGAGLYKASVTFDASGDVSSFGTVTLVKSCGTWTGGGTIERPNIRELHSWSPDGTKVVYHVSSVGTCIYDTASDVETTLVSGGAFGQWSPDGNYICYFKNQELRIIKPDGTGDSLVVAEKNSGKVWDWIRDPMWSADSKFLIYRYTTENGNKWPPTSTKNLYIIGIDGDGKKCVTNGLDGPAWELPVGWR